MSDPFVAEIRIFSFNFPPQGWAFCNGQLMLIQQNTALFALLGTTYGGDGVRYYALPNMQGNAPLQPGQGAGLSLYDLGEVGGSTTVTVTSSDMPSHTHSLMADALPADVPAPAATRSYARTSSGSSYRNTTTSLTAMAQAAIGVVGGGMPHNNLQPYLTLNFCISLGGIFPPRG